LSFSEINQSVTHTEYNYTNNTELINQTNNFIMEENENMLLLHDTNHINNIINYKNIRIFTVNINGMKRNRHFIDSIMLYYDIIILLETWITDGEQIKEWIAINSHKIHYKNAIKAQEKMTGHGKGGICFLVKNSLRYKPRFISNGIGVLSIKGTIIVGVYLPHNKKENESIFRLELENLKDLILTAKQNSKDIIMIGDFNVDFKSKPIKHTKLLTNLLIDTDMMVWDMVYCKDIVYTYYKDKDRTYIDHVIGNMDNNNINKIELFDDTSLIKSDHYGLKVNINIKIDSNYQYETIEVIRPKQYWNMSYYVMKYENKLRLVVNPMVTKFKSLLSTKLDQTERVEKFENYFEILHNEINFTSKEVNDEISHKINTGYISIKPWFTDKIIEQQKESNRLHNLYLKTKIIMYENQSKCLDKTVRKNVREQENKYKHNELINLEKLRYVDSKQFWNIIDSRLNKKIECETNLQETKNEFETTFTKKLVISDDIEAEDQVQQFINETKSVVYDEEVYEHEVKLILKDLKNGKSTGSRNVSNEMYKYASSTKLVTILTLMIQLLINFGCVFEKINMTIIKPIIKDAKKSLNSINNIRPISISDVFHTVMEKWILDKLNDMYNHCPNQFGFRKGYSCQHAITTVLESIKVTKRKKKRLYLCLIDASKAFDKINRAKLWIIMKNFCRSAVLRYLILYYSNSYATVQLNNQTSEKFKTKIGVKQGGCLSPLLFAIYVADIMDEIKNINIGVKIGAQYVNLLMYADDIALITETRSDMAKLLQIIEKYGHKKEIKFNGSKTNLLIFNKKSKKSTKRELEEEITIELKLDGERIVETEEARYLGFILNVNNINSAHLNNRYTNFLNKIMTLNKLDFDKPEMPSKTKSILYKAHLRPLLFYGIDCLRLNPGEIKNLYSYEGNSIKLAHGLYTGIHSTELFLALGMDITENLVKLNRVKLFLRLVKCSYTKSILQSIINENEVYPVEDSIVNDIMDYVNCEAMDLEQMEELSKQYVSTKVKSFKDEMKENETVNYVRQLLNKLPNSKMELETTLKAYDLNIIQDDEEYVNINDLVNGQFL
jgi:hypothetical protein